MKPSHLIWVVRGLAAVPVLSFIACWWLPRFGIRVAIGASVVATIALLIVLACGWVSRGQQTVAAACVGLGAVMASGAPVYLARLASDPYDNSIPLGGVGALFLGMALLIFGTPFLRRPTPARAGGPVASMDAGDGSALP